MQKLMVLCTLAAFFSIANWSNDVLVTDCDRLAAAPADLQRQTPGILLNQIDPTRAIPACESAVRRYPNDARFSFQLSRAYYKAKQFEAAVGQLKHAADHGYAAAQYNLGLMYEYGQSVIEDYGSALFWYHKAAEQGDGMAKDKLGGLT